VIIIQRTPRVELAIKLLAMGYAFDNSVTLTAIQAADLFVYLKEVEKYLNDESKT